MIMSQSITDGTLTDTHQICQLFTYCEQLVHMTETKSSYYMNIFSRPMNIQELFSTEERSRILEHVMFRENLRVTQISRALNLSKGLVSTFMRTLQANGLVRKAGNLYTPTDGFAAREVRRLINLSKVRLRRMDKQGIEGVGLYGSWSRGTNTIESDLDIWVTATEYPQQEYLAKLSSQLRKMFGGEVRLLVLTPTKLERIKADDVFFSNLVRDSILLWGESIV